LQLGVQFAGQALRQSQDDDAAAPEAAADSNVILEEMKDMQVLRITANGRLFRYAGLQQHRADSVGLQEQSEVGAEHTQAVAVTAAVSCVYVHLLLWLVGDDACM
jgi:hypothetical protein